MNFGARGNEITIARKQEAIYGVSSHEINLVFSRKAKLLPSIETIAAGARFNERLISLLHRANRVT